MLKEKNGKRDRENENPNTENGVQHTAHRIQNERKSFDLSLNSRVLNLETLLDWNLVPEN